MNNIIRAAYRFYDVQSGYDSYVVAWEDEHQVVRFGRQSTIGMNCVFAIAAYDLKAQKWLFRRCHKKQLLARVFPDFLGLPLHYSVELDDPFNLERAEEMQPHWQQSADAYTEFLKKYNLSEF